MTKEEFAIVMTYLGTIYNKQFTSQELTVWYSFFHNINSSTFKLAIKKIAETNKYMPSIAEILTKCEETKVIQRNNIIEKMRDSGYFKNEKEIEKAYNWVQENNIPYWFKEDMKKYYQLMLENNDNLLIEGHNG